MSTKRVKTRHLRAFVAFAIAAAFVVIFVACDASNSLVGGSCANTYLECSPGICIDVVSDPQNCGQCGTTCSAGVACNGGVCGGALDGSTDGSANDGANLDGQSGDGANTDGSNLNDGAIAEGSTSDACIPPFDTASSCGTCGNVCVAPDSVCDPVDGGFACGPFCTDPALPTDCNNVCVDLTSDPNNCGACGKICASGICVASACQGSVTGDIVLIGHDFSGALNSTAPAHMLTNAAFIPTSNPLRVLSYEQFANATAVNAVKSTIQAGATARTKTVKFTVSTNAADLAATNLATKYDVVLIYDQATMTPAQATTLGTNAQAGLGPFGHAGGMIILLAGANGQDVMPAFSTAAGLVSIAGDTFLPTTPPPPTHATVVEPGDDIATGTVSPYAVASRSVSFQSSEPNGGSVTYVVLTGSTPNPLGDPIVIHKIAP